MDRIEKHLCKIPSVEFYPLVDLLRGTDTTPETTVDLLPGKCYSVTHNYMIEECVERKSQLDPCAETDIFTLYGYLETALTKGPLESALQLNKDTKDGQAVIREI